MIARVAIPPRPDPNPHLDPISVAIVDLSVERGYEQVRVEDVVERAGVGAEEFQRRYTGKEDCALRVFETLAAEFEWRVGTAYNRESEWRSALRAAAGAAADWMLEVPNVVRFGTVEVLAMESEMARVRREEAFAYCAGLIDRGREEAPDRDAIPEGAAAVAIGSIMHLLTHRLQRGDEVDPHAIIPELMYGVVRPYLGEEIARQELEMPRPEPGGPGPRP
jgi:AcrR family transcriptional regulator